MVIGISDSVDGLLRSDPAPYEVKPPAVAMSIGLLSNQQAFHITQFDMV